MKHILMVQWGRVGSTVLGDLLGQHPDVHWSGEILRGPSLLFPQRGGRPTRYSKSPYFPHEPIGWMRHQMRRRTKPRFGCEVKPWHIGDNGFTEVGFLAHATRLDFDSFVLLHRRNNLRRIVSVLVAAQTKRHHVPLGAEVKLHRVRIDCPNLSVSGHVQPLLHHLRAWDRELATFRELLQGRTVADLEYERDVQDDPLVAFNKIREVAGLPPAMVTVTLARTNPFPLKDMVENLDEVSAYLADTPYSWMAEGDA